MPNPGLTYALLSLLFVFLLSFSSLSDLIFQFHSLCLVLFFFLIPSRLLCFSFLSHFLCSLSLSQFMLSFPYSISLSFLFFVWPHPHVCSFIFALCLFALFLSFSRFLPLLSFFSLSRFPINFPHLTDSLFLLLFCCRLLSSIYLTFSSPSLHTLTEQIEFRHLRSYIIQYMQCM